MYNHRGLYIPIMKQGYRNYCLINAELIMNILPRDLAVAQTPVIDIEL